MATLLHHITPLMQKSIAEAANRIGAMHLRFASPITLFYIFYALGTIGCSFFGGGINGKRVLG